jgi:hypothetical protein
LRQDRWKHGAYDAVLKEKYHSFDTGRDDFLNTINVTHSDITRHMNAPMETQHYVQEQHTMATKESTHTFSQELDELRKTLTLLEDGGSGYLPNKKRSGLIRISFETWNSLGIHTNNWKVDKLNGLIRSLHLDVLTGCEVQCNWRYCPP